MPFSEQSRQSIINQPCDLAILAVAVIGTIVKATIDAVRCIGCLQYALFINLMYFLKIKIMSNPKVPTDTSTYKKHYSDSAFWSKVKKLGKNVLKPALMLFYVMKSPDVPLAIKTRIAGALGYLILPVDLIPDFIPVAGYTDDAGALYAVIKICKEYITPEIEAQAENKLNELLG